MEPQNQINKIQKLNFQWKQINEIKPDKSQRQSGKQMLAF